MATMCVNGKSISDQIDDYDARKASRPMAKAIVQRLYNLDYLKCNDIRGLAALSEVIMDILIKGDL